jgi:hypothetical protein
LVLGPAEFPNNREETIVNLCCEREDEKLHQLVKDQMSLENVGVTIRKIDRRKSEEDRAVVKKIDSSIKKIGKHFQVGLPYVDFETMPNNQKAAIHRLMCALKRNS